MRLRLLVIEDPGRKIGDTVRAAFG